MAKQWKQSLTSSDVQAEAEGALEKDINNLSPANNSIAANLDGGVAAVDWASKTPKSTNSTSVTVQGNSTKDIISISGSGYATAVRVVAGTTPGNLAGVKIDGTLLEKKDFDEMADHSVTFTDSSDGFGIIIFDSIYRFESSLVVEAELTSSGDTDFGVGVDYVLD